MFSAAPYVRKQENIMFFCVNVPLKKKTCTFTLSHEYTVTQKPHGVLSLSHVRCSDKISWGLIILYFILP